MSWKDMQKELSSRWKKLSLEEKAAYQSIAERVFIQNKMAKERNKGKILPAYMT